ncbi:DnaJ domain-containing protein [Colwellia sp. MSW7]|uniref:DnaJ domain-containing protein n=1 Tax=Colwellia maritima TaxID=2912588 RepID=A0ABS9X170_9GAMM|nr:DnaJ domain-containing protein [Colwellia maritima]
MTSEHQIIKHLQKNKITPFERFNLANTKDLFSAHFLCMHGLYHLKNQYQLSQKFTLIIQSVRIQRIALNNSTSNNYNVKTALETPDPLESYYLNAKHYYDTQEEEITELLKSFWQQYIAQDNKKEALEILALPSNADAKMIKAQYLRLAQKHHPDKGGCVERFKEIRAAKSVLDKVF